MRKITSLILALIAFAGLLSKAEAQTTEASATDLPQLTTDESAPIWYTIKNTRSGKYATYLGDSTYIVQRDGISTSSLFYFTGTESGGTITAKIHNLAAGTKLCEETNLWTESGKDWIIKAIVSTTGLTIGKPDNFMNYAWNDYYGDGDTIDYYVANDIGSFWIIQPAPLSTIYHELKDSALSLTTNAGKVFYLTKENAAAISATIPSAEPTSTEGYSAAVTAMYKAINAERQYVMPEAGKEYFIKNFQYNTYIGKGYAKPNVVTVKDMGFDDELRNTGYHNEALAQVFTLEAGSKEGFFKFKNKATGTYVNSSLSLGDYGYEFKITRADSVGMGTGFISNGYDSQFSEWHMDENKQMVYWNTISPASRWIFEPVTKDETMILPTYSFETIGEQASEVASTFGIVNEFEYASAKIIFDSSPTYKNGQALLEAARLAIEKQPLRIRSVNTDVDNLLGANGNKGHAYADELSNANAIWKVVAVEDGFKLHNLNTDKYLGLLPALAENTALMTNYDDGVKFTFTGNNSDGFKIVDQYGGHMYCETNGNINNWQYGNRALWFIFPATEFEVLLNTVGGNSFATAYLPFATKVQEGTKAYTVTPKADDASVVLAEEKSDGIVAAGEGVILKNEAGEDTIRLNILTEEYDKVAGNILSGTFQTIENIDPNDYYIFGNGDQGIGFYRPDANSLIANKAYIAANGIQATALRLSFGGTTTGIGSIATDSEKTNAPIYDLSGRRVTRAVKGIYIQGGKKIMVK